MKTSTLCPSDGWRTRYRQEHPDTGRSQGTSTTKAWSNSRDAGELLGVTARLHPQLRGCINALDLPEARPVFNNRWLEHVRRSNVPDGLVIRHSGDDPVPLWGNLMRAKRLRLRLAVIGWSQGLALEKVQDMPIRYWEDFLGVEQVRERMVRSGKPRDVKEKLALELTRLREEATRATPSAHPDPRSGLPGHCPLEWSPLYEKYRTVRGRFPDDGIKRTGLSREMLSQGWHLVAPLQTLGWMVADSVLGDTRHKATSLGMTHLGLKDGFRSADRARFFLKLSRQHRDLATLTLQRIIIWALADLGVVPPTITDAGMPIQTLLVGRHQQRDCCVLISGEHLHVWYRSGAIWSPEPALHMRLPDDFAMVILGEDTVALEGVRDGGRPCPIVISQLQLHTFPRTPSTFPAKAWADRTGLRLMSVIPRVSRSATGLGVS